MNIYESSAPCTLSAADKKNYKRIVTSVMKANGTVNECDSVGIKKEYNRYLCPKEGCKDSKFVSGSSGFLIPKGAGFSNGFRHLSTCYGSTEKVWQLYERGMLRQNELGGSILAHFKSFGASQVEKEMCTFIEGAVLKNWQPDPWIRIHLNFTQPFGVKKVKEVIHHLVQIIEEKIADELKHVPRFSILHDGWSKGGTHYVGLFICYNKVSKVIVKGQSFERSIPVIRLLACSPLPGVDNEDDELFINMSDEEKEIYLEEALTFNAKVHAQFIINTFDLFYGINEAQLIERLVNQTSDSAAVNVKLAKILKIPHIGCYNHKLHNQVEAMVKNNHNLKSK